MENDTAKKINIYPLVAFIFFVIVFSFEFIFMSGIQARWSGATFPEYHDGRQVQGTVKKFFNFSQQGGHSIKLVLADDQIFYITRNAYNLCNKDRVYERIQHGSEVSLYVSDEGDMAFIMAMSCDGIEYLNFETTKSEWQEDYIAQVLRDFPAIQFCNIALVILLVIIAIQTDMGMKKNGYYPNRRTHFIGCFLLFLVTVMVVFMVSSNTYAGYEQAATGRMYLLAGEKYWGESVAYYKEAFSCYRKGMIWASTSIIVYSFIHLVATSYREVKEEMKNRNAQ